MAKGLMGVAAAALGVAMALSSPARANVVVLTFEGVGDGASIDNFYNGGTDSYGNSGPNFGIQFSGGLGLVDADAGGGGNFANEPTASTVMYFLSQDSAILNYAAGFSTGFSFYYTSLGAASVSVYDGLGGTGNLLGTLSLAGQYNGNGCTGDPSGQYCNWTPVGVTFGGLAKSINFGGAANYVAFDNITFGSEVPGSGGASGVPEPSTWAMMIVGLFGMGSALRAARRRRAAAIAAA